VDSDQSGPIYRFGDYRLDAAQRTLTQSGREVPLTPTLFEILRVLVENAGRILEKDRLMEHVWAGRVVEEGNLARNVSTLRKLLGDDSQSPRYIQTVVRRGYRFVAKVETLTVEGEPPPAEQQEAEHAARRAAAAPAEPSGDAASVSSAGSPGRTDATHGTRRRVLPVAGSRLVHGSVAAACLALLGVIVAASYISSGPARARIDSLLMLPFVNSPSMGSGATRTRIDSLLVLPFVNLSGDPDVEYIADGLTALLIVNLGQIAALDKVISFNTSRYYKDSRKPLPEIAREVDVNAVVEGTVFVDGDRILVTMQVVEAATERRLAGTEPAYGGGLEDVLSLQSRIAHTIVTAIEIAVTPEESRRLADAGSPVDADTNVAYLRGLYLKNRQTVESLHQAIEHFDQALAKTPDFAPALAAKGDAFIMLASWQGPSRTLWPEAREAARRALEIDDTLAEAHLVRAGAWLCYDLNHAAADRAFLRAIQLNPNDALTRHRYGYSLMTQGRFEESLAQARRAVELNPVSLAHNVMLAKILFYAGRHEDARHQLQRTLELDDRFPEAHRTLGQLKLETHEIDLAIAAFERAIANGGGLGILGELAYAYGLAGRRQEALGLLDELLALSREGRDTAFSIALLHHGLDDTDRALEWLYKAYEERDFRMILLLVDPIWNTLRPDPRFRDLLLQIGLGSELPA
jgi:DNA-binding winged helix-turn-helix (wHTH) protein/TolB-like protein/Flp pilus assembly protein TadD